jgi:exopolysaccharide biosynthesis protein
VPARNAPFVRTFRVNGGLVNNTSDATGERPVGDTIQVLP